MTVCPMCGNEFEPKDVEEYIGKLFGYDAVKKIRDDIREKWNIDKICDSCCMSIYYSEHPDEK